MTRALAYLLGITLILSSLYVAQKPGVLPYVPSAQTTSAASIELLGYAWSENIGWISVNCATTPAGCDGTSDYAVTLDTVTNELTGFAWSENIGWIEFGGSANSGCPYNTSGPQPPCEARMDGSELMGWARVNSGDGIAPPTMVDVYTYNTSTTTYTTPTTDTSFVVPAGVTSMIVKAWGAGGGAGGQKNNPGGGGGGGAGGGGFAEGKFDVIEGESLTVRVGGGGIGGVGGQGGSQDGGAGGGGGGYSGIFRGAVPVIIAGGGGGGGGGGDSDNGDPFAGAGGGGGGAVASDGIFPGGDGSDKGDGGTQVAGGIGGSGFNAGNDGEVGEVDGRYEGGDGGDNPEGGTGKMGGTGGLNGGGTGGRGASNIGNTSNNVGGAGGGGGGYYGGGGGEAGLGDENNAGGGGGGGSGYVSIGTDTQNLQGTTGTIGGNGVGGLGGAAANTSDPDYAIGVGKGGNGTGGGVTGKGNDGERGHVVVVYITEVITPTPMPAPTNGWDGWISLNSMNGLGGDYRVEVGATELNGFAWGSDVVGWISFNCSNEPVLPCANSNYKVYFNSPCSVGYACTVDNSQSVYTDPWCATATTTCNVGEMCRTDMGSICGPGNPTGQLEFTGQRVRKGNTTNISWPTLAAYDMCRLQSTPTSGLTTNPTTWSSTTPLANVTTPSIQNEVTYTLECTQIGDLSATYQLLDTERVTVLPAIKEF